MPKITLEIIVSGDIKRQISPAEASQFLIQRPTLAEHACRQNGVGRFGQKITGCRLPHLLEHLSIDLLVERCACQIAGNTSYRNVGQGAGGNQGHKSAHILLRALGASYDEMVKAVLDARLLVLQILASSAFNR
ncbi:MAG: hypothetical protein FWF30_00760 [Coriobacteriia bacterium]|nr:hypothetical protein [Coriobacteriia bacterium]